MKHFFPGYTMVNTVVFSINCTFVIEVKRKDLYRKRYV